MMWMEAPKQAREVKKIVIAYDLKSLPPALIRSFNLLRGKIARKRLRVEVLMRPVHQLPADSDVIFVPRELLETAQQAVPEAKRIGLLDTERTYQSAFDELLRDLDAGDEIFARSVDEAGSLERAGDHGGFIVRYRGNERLG